MFGASSRLLSFFMQPLLTIHLLTIPTMAGSLQVPQVQQVIFVVDNDENIGSFGDMSLLRSLWVRLRIHCDRRQAVEDAIRVMSDNRLFRHGLQDFFAFLVGLRAAGVAKAIVMCTGATDAHGWVSFLKDVLEAWFGEHIYDLVIDGQQLRRWHERQGSDAIKNSAFVKDMDMVRELLGVAPHFPVVAIDDRAENILAHHGLAVGVSPYRVPLDFRSACEETMALESWELYVDVLRTAYKPADVTDPDMDVALEDAVERIRRWLYPSAPVA
jgi:hypothetical protein